MGQNSGEDGFRASAGAQRDARVDPVLQAKYLDYCSARISEVFLSLTDEHTYQIMEEAAHEANLAVGTLGFQTKMQLVTRRLRRSVPLPDLETWAKDYARNPEQYDPYLLGFWESEETDRSGPEGGEG